MVSADNTGEEYWAWVTRYQDGTVGNISVFVQEMGGHMVLLARSLETANKMRMMAEIHHRATGQACWLRHFKMVEDKVSVIGE